MIKHIILWKLDSRLTAEQKTDTAARAKAGLEALAGQIPGLLEIHVETSHLASSSADMMLDSSFESEAALAVYRTHPAHVAAADALVRPFTETRLCLDFEI